VAALVAVFPVGGNCGGVLQHESVKEEVRSLRIGERGGRGGYAPERRRWRHLAPIAMTLACLRRLTLDKLQRGRARRCQRLAREGRGGKERWRWGGPVLLY
jgi:hypothetical protein